MTQHKASWSALTHSDALAGHEVMLSGPASSISSNVSSARTDDELGTTLERNQGKLVWTMFGSSWCHHCHELFPSVYEISKRFPKHEFVVAQMDYMDHAVKGIKYTPTFRLYKKGRREAKAAATPAPTREQEEQHHHLHSRTSPSPLTVTIAITIAMAIAIHLQ